MIPQTRDPGIRRDPYLHLILLRAQTRDHRAALTEAGVRFQDVEVGRGE